MNLSQREVLEISQADDMSKNKECNELIETKSKMKTLTLPLSCDTNVRRNIEQDNSVGEITEHFQNKQNMNMTNQDHWGSNEPLVLNRRSVTHLRGGGPQPNKKRKEAGKPKDSEMKKYDTDDLEKIYKSSPRTHFKNSRQVEDNIKSEQMYVLKETLLDIRRRRNFTEDTKEARKNFIPIIRNKIENLPIVREHLYHKYLFPGCIICEEPDVHLELGSFLNRDKNIVKKYEYVKIMEVRQNETKPVPMEKDEEIQPVYCDKVNHEFSEQEYDGDDDNVGSTSETNAFNDQGVINFTLSNRQFINKGWTALPTEKIVRKSNMYRMRPAHPEFNWFQIKKKLTYKTGEKLAVVDDKGCTRWYYKNGGIALDYYTCEDSDAVQRIVIYSNTEVDVSCRPQPLTVLAIFDYIGSGIVFDHSGKTRLKFNQTEGIVMDSEIGPPGRWKWHSLNDPPVLEKVMLETKLIHKDEAIKKDDTANKKKGKDDDAEMVAIEIDNIMKHQKECTTNMVLEAYQIRIKAVKINQQFSLKIIDQQNIHINYRDGPDHLKFNIGLVLDTTEIVAFHTEELGECLNSVDKKPPETRSLEKLQRYLGAQRKSHRLRRCNK